jgi:hypothetical protein
MQQAQPLRPNRLYVEQTLRCFMLPVERRAASATKAKKENEPVKSLVAQQVEAAGRPFGGFCLIFDTETFMFDHGQKVRFGAYQLRGVTHDERASFFQTAKNLDDYRRRLDRPIDWGLFYNPTFTDAEAIKTLKSFRETVHRSFLRDPVTNESFPPLNLMTVQDFIKKVLYGCAKDYGKDLLIIGHNLAFDNGALSTHAAPSQDEFFFGGFTLKLCDCEVRKADGSPSDDKLKCIDHPPMQVKPIGAKKRMFGWRTEGLREGAGTKTVAITAHCLDTSQFARALLGPIDTRLENLTSDKVFATRTRKSKFEAHDGPSQRNISPIALTTCRRLSRSGTNSESATVSMGSQRVHGKFIAKPPSARGTIGNLVSPISWSSIRASRPKLSGFTCKPIMGAAPKSVSEKGFTKSSTPTSKANIPPSMR